MENRILRTKRNHNPNSVLSQRSKDTFENNLSLLHKSKGREIFVTLTSEQTETHTSQEYNSASLFSVDEEFSELIQALIDNVEDENAVK
jgi:hypothetical protein